MFSNNLKIWSSYRKLLPFIVIIFAIFTPFTEVYSTEARRFLTGEEILENHRTLKAAVDDCYSQIIGETPEHYQDYFYKSYEEFDFKKCVNFCIGGIQWLMKKKDSEEYNISDFSIFTGKTGKTLIFSNTSTYQWTGKILDHYQILSWPYEKIQGCLEPYISSFISSKHKQFKTWKTSGKKFDKIYFPQLFPLSCKKERQQITDADILTDLNNTEAKYFSALDQVVFQSYDSLFSSEKVPTIFLAKIPEWQNHCHSEPLLCWWVQQNLLSLKAPLTEEYEVVCPIISLYTERQTCLIPCEQVVQKCATNFYVPLISFTEPYKRNKEIILAGITSKITLNNGVGFPPSIMEPAIRLSGSHLDGMIRISKPDFVNWEIVNVFQSSEDTQQMREITRFPIQFQLPPN